MGACHGQWSNDDQYLLVNVNISWESESSALLVLCASLAFDTEIGIASMYEPLNVI